jgi:hypothetical protein
MTIFGDACVDPLALWAAPAHVGRGDGAPKSGF